MFNFFKKKQREFIFSDLAKILSSSYLETKLQRDGGANFIERSRNLKIPDEEIEKNLKKIILDLQNSDIEFIGEIYPYVVFGEQRELFLKFRIGKYFLCVTCKNDYSDYHICFYRTLENLKEFSERLESSLKSKNSFVIFNEDLQLFRNIKFDYNESFIVFGNMYLKCDFLKGYGFLAKRISEYINSFGKIILNKFLLEISEMEKKELEKYLEEVKIIGAKNIEVTQEFSPLFQKTKRLSEISDEIKNLYSEIQNIRKSI